MDLFYEIQRRLDMLDAEVREASKAGREYAEAEAKYRCALAVEMLRLRDDEGRPVTLVPDLARGKREIAALKVKRDTSEAIYKASLEAINASKLRIRILDAQLSREYNS